MFCNKEGWRRTRLCHSSLSIFPSILLSASSNVYTHTNQFFFLNTSCQRITMRKAYSMVIGYQFNQSPPCLWWSLSRHQKDSCQIQLESPPSFASTSHQIEDQRNETHKHVPKNNTNCTSCLSINPWCFRSYSLKATAEAQRDHIKELWQGWISRKKPELFYYLHSSLSSIRALGWKTEIARAKVSKSRIPVCLVSNKSNTCKILNMSSRQGNLDDVGS